MKNAQKMPVVLTPTESRGVKMDRTLHLKGDQIFESDNLVCTINGLDADNRLIRQESEAKAKELVRRWNSFEGLLAACELGVEVMNEQKQALQTICDGIAKKAGLETPVIPQPPTDILEAAIKEANTGR